MRRTATERNECVMHNAKVCFPVLMLPGVIHNRTTSSSQHTHTHTHTHTHKYKPSHTQKPKSAFISDDPIQVQLKSANDSYGNTKHGKK